MSLPVPVKIKDEPLDPEYGDVIPELSSSSEKNKNLDTEIRNDINEILNSNSFLDNDVQNSENNLSSVKIKTEKPDSPPPQEKIKTEPEDFPEDFFDCLNDNNFLNEISERHSDESNIDTSQLNSDSDSSKNKSINQASIEKEIEKTEKIISAKQKLVLKKSKKSHKDKQIKFESESEETSKGSEENHKKHHSKKKRKSRSRERHHSRKSDRNKFEDGKIDSDDGKNYRRRSRRSSSLESYSKRKRSPSRSISRSKSREKNRSSTKKRQRRSRSRSRSSSRPTSRERIRMRSLRSRSRSMSRSYSRSPSYSNSRRHRRSRSRSRSRSSCRDSSHSHLKSKKLSFLEELEKTFAKQGKSFPEKDLLSKMDISKEYLKAAKKASYKHLMPVPKIIKTESTKNDTNDQPYSTPEKMDTDETESQAQPPPPPPEEEEISFPRPFIIKEEPQDDGYDRPYSSSSITNKPSTSTKPGPPLKPTIKEEKLETIAQRRERVLNTCTEAIKKLHMYEKNESEAIFTYTPTIIQEKTIEEITKYRSPLHNIHNLQFKFNSSTPTDINLKSYGLKSLPQKSAKLAKIIGIDALTIFEKLNHKDLPYSLKMLKKSTVEEKNKNDNDEKKSTDYKPFYTSVGVQTEPYSCSTCILRQLRKFHDIGVQSQPFCEDNYTQVDPLMLGMPIQQNQQHYQQQQQFYPSSMVPNVNQTPQMMPPQTVMYNNYGPSYPPSGHSYYPTPSGQPISTNYGQPQPPMMNMMPIQTSQHPIYPQIKSHPGPRSIPSTLSSSAINRRSHNIVLPTNRNN